MKNADQFVITLKNERTKRYIRLGYVLAAFNFVPFLLFLFSNNTRMAGITGFVSTILYFIIRIIIVKKKKGQHYIDENIFFILAAVWLLQSILMAVMILLTGILFLIALQPLRFIFTEASIQKDFFPKKEYGWDEMQTLILKDGILTMDFKNNKLLQAGVEPISEEEVKQFNEFAHRILQKRSSTDEVIES